VLRFLKGFGPLVLLYLLIVYALPRPLAVKQDAWQLFAVFVTTVAGLILQPVPGGAMVLIGVVCASIAGGLPIQNALSGYSDPMVWLVLTAFLISRALLNTGLARRIALVFVRMFGKTSVGITYALAATDAVLATIIPSNGARSGGVTLPIARSIAELYESRPGVTAGRLGAFLMVATYQSICMTAAMFFTGQASNPIAAQIATQNGFPITWGSWFVAGSVPGIVSLAVIPLLVMRLFPPEVRVTPEAAEFAAGELRKMGGMTLKEKILAVVFAGVCAMWATAGSHGIDITVTALVGAAALLLTGVLTWEDVKSEKTAWDMFIWYMPVLMAAGVALTLSNAKAVMEALVGYETGFVRTPKYAVGDKKVKLGNERYKSRIGWLPFFEIAAGTWFLAMIAYSIDSYNFLALPFLSLFTGGYYWAAGSKLWFDYQAKQAWEREHKLALEAAR
jgi:divalent anion:Na+ symporter, DASS family